MAVGPVEPTTSPTAGRTQSPRTTPIKKPPAAVRSGSEAVRLGSGTFEFGSGMLRHGADVVDHGQYPRRREQVVGLHAVGRRRDVPIADGGAPGEDRGLGAGAVVVRVEDRAVVDAGDDRADGLGGQEAGRLDGVLDRDDVLVAGPCAVTEMRRM